MLPGRPEHGLRRRQFVLRFSCSNAAGRIAGFWSGPGLCVAAIGAGGLARSCLGWVYNSSPVVLLYDITSSLRRGEIGLDIVAALSMSAALVVGEELAAVVVALMYSGGQFLEAFAERHARREMTALLGACASDGRPAPERHPGRSCTGNDRAGRPAADPAGRRCPGDGVVASGLAVLDQSALTGESIPVQQRNGEEAMSGSTNAGEAFDLIASRRRRGKYLCRYRAPGGSSAAFEGADVTACRSFCDGLSCY